MPAKLYQSRSLRCSFKRMIDARLWTRPSPDEIRAMVERVAGDGSITPTVREIGARLGVGRRVVFYWMSPKQEPGREIGYCEYLALKALCEESGDDRAKR